MVIEVEKILYSRVGKCRACLLQTDVELMRNSEVFAKFCSDAHGLLLRVAFENVPMVYEALTVFTKDKSLPMNVEAFVARRTKLRNAASHIDLEADNMQLCNHKNPDGSDARYPSGSNGELACVCGNRWD